MHTRAACSHCMQERKSGFRFQNAEGQRHAAVVAEGKLRRTASISQSAKGPARPVPAALRKASFAAKSAAALAALWALRGEGAPSESPSAFRSAGPKTLAAKVEPWGPPRLFAIRAVSQRSQPMPYIMICLFSAKTASLICMIKSEKFKQNVQISLGKLEVLPQVVYNKS